MVTFKISDEDWKVLRLKLKRKYIGLTEEDLQYSAGQEDELVERLAKRVRRSKDYIFFTLSKEMIDLTSNRL